MKPADRAVQATRSRILELVKRATPVPSAGEVLIAVEARGICVAEAGDFEGA
ncbi:MAG TPA: hypothetical protein PKA55_01105 [Rhodoblastus sp.]|nr:hypothetical protein [Rhodoblastus sp.]